MKQANVRSPRGRSRGRTLRPGRTGAVAVEFAMVAPILLLMVFGMLEFGRAIMVHQVVTNAAREGARRSIIPGATDSDVQAVVQDHLAGAGFSQHTITITPSLASARSGDQVAVNVRIPYGQVTWGILKWLQRSDISATARMRKE